MSKLYDVYITENLTEIDVRSFCMLMKLLPTFVVKFLCIKFKLKLNYMKNILII